MKRLKTFLAVAFILTAFCTSAQTITGKVIDFETKAPLEGASVFAQNTTKGVITDKEGNFRIPLGKGGFELIISYTGYISHNIKVETSEDKNLDIELHKEDMSLSEVVIISSNEVEDGWEKYGDFFLKHFIGATPFAENCILQNPEVLKFFYYKRTDKIKVLATEPLLITNNSLGYNLRYLLDSFVYHNQTAMNSYRGNCLYTAMEGTGEQQEIWKENRRKAYVGSRLHFLRSYFDSTLKDEGFTVDILTASNKFGRLSNPYDSSYYYSDAINDDVELFFPKKISITYAKNPPDIKYLQQYQLPHDVNIQISYVDLTDAILIKPNGYFFDQRSWINQGYWSWKNLADQLPYDYEIE